MFAFNDQFMKIDEAESYVNGFFFLALKIVTSDKLIMRYPEVELWKNS